MQFGDYVFFNATNNGITPLEGFRQHLDSISSSTKINFAQGAQLWSDDQPGFPEAVQMAQNSDVVIVMVNFHQEERSSMDLTDCLCRLEHGPSIRLCFGRRVLMRQREKCVISRISGSSVLSSSLSRRFNLLENRPSLCMSLESRSRNPGSRTVSP